MSCTNSVPIPSVSFPVDFQPCFSDLLLESYALTSYTVRVTSTVATNGVVNSTFVFSTINGPASVNATYNPQTLTLTVVNVNLPSNAGAFRTTAVGNPPLTAVVIFTSLVAGRSPIKFEFNYAAFSGFITASGSFFSPGISFSLPTSDSIPNITATILPTPDNKEVCELLFTVTFLGECGEIIVQEYKQYCVSFTSIVCAPGCRKGTGSTLREKILALGEGEAFLQYIVLRYVISGLIGDCFDVNSLRQRYAKTFLKKVSNTQYKIFLPILKANPNFEKYLCY